MANKPAIPICADCGKDPAQCSCESMPKFSNFAAYLARTLFAVGDNPESPCRRIEFKGGNWKDRTETAQGGFCEGALARHLEQNIKAYLST